MSFEWLTILYDLKDWCMCVCVCVCLFVSVVRHLTHLSSFLSLHFGHWLCMACMIGWVHLVLLLMLVIADVFIWFLCTRLRPLPARTKYHSLFLSGVPTVRPSVPGTFPVRWCLRWNSETHSICLHPGPDPQRSAGSQTGVGRPGLFLGQSCGQYVSTSSLLLTPRPLSLWRFPGSLDFKLSSIKSVTFFCIFFCI